MSVRDHTPEWISLDGAVNARAVIPGVLLRADNLQELSAEDVRRLVEEQSLEVVLDLRTDTEVESEGPGPITAESAVRVEHRSLYPDSGGNTDLDAAVKPWGREDQDGLPDETPIVRAYVSYLRRRPDSVVGSVRTIARAGGAVLVHCAAGKDRTGVVVAMALDAAGIDREAIVSDYLATEERIHAILTRLTASPTYRDELKDTYPSTHKPVATTMERFFAVVDEEFGGSVQWLAAHGMDDADLERLRDRLTGWRAGADRRATPRPRSPHAADPASPG
jgi:protein-tyrosine phosphatase